MSKVIIYQLLPRLFGNDNHNHIYNGSINQNGCGKLNDISTKVLKKLKELGTTHIWYTGLLEHATSTNYSVNGIARDHTAMVKGKAGSPYAVKDYYDIDPDLASCPTLRWQEFQQLVERTHRAGLGFIMDFVPNHVARQYHSDVQPKEICNLGELDNSEQAFSPQNNFYYIPGHQLHCSFDMKGDEEQPYYENPAKATGNDCFSASPGNNDWYETIKLNYGIDYMGGRIERFNPTPNTWKQMLLILLFWAEQGVDAFRCDMAEMVPCAFWDWAVPQVKAQFPQILFIGEVYNPSLYRDYLFRGHFDYLYDKVGLYDTLRAVTCGMRPASAISDCWKSVGDIQSHMLNFLENHDEQRLASEYFAGNGERGKAALLVSACMNTNPFMLYFGQEFGERGMDNEGFSGQDGRTSIFDYWSVDSICAWRNGGSYTLTNLSPQAKELYTFYKKVLRLSQKEKALSEGKFYDIMYANYDNLQFDSTKLFAFVRQVEHELILVISNFSDKEESAAVLIPQHAFEFLNLPTGVFQSKELLSNRTSKIKLSAESKIQVALKPYHGALIKITY